MQINHPGPFKEGNKTPINRNCPGERTDGRNI